MQGVFVPIVTPFDADNRVNLGELKKLAEAFITQGVAGIVVCGTTGEYYTLTEDERKQVLECVASVGKGRVELMAGVSGLSTAEAITRAHQAEALGYDSLMLATPPYSLPGQEEVVAHFKAVAKATKLPITMYNFPARVGVEIGIDAVTELSKVPNIVGLKESSGDFSRALALIKADLPDFEIVCGCDDQAADFLFWGVRTWISGAANVFPGEQVKMVKAALDNDWAQVQSLMKGMLPAIQNMESGNYNQKAKLGVRRHGVQAGAVRQPLLPLSGDESKVFSDLLDEYDR